MCLDPQGTHGIPVALWRPPYMIATFRRDYLLRLPLPLAQAYSRAFNAKDPYNQHNNARSLFEALLKLTAIPAIACYLHEVAQGAPRVPAVDSLLGKLIKPMLGEWV